MQFMHLLHYLRINAFAGLYRAALRGARERIQNKSHKNDTTRKLLQRYRKSYCREKWLKNEQTRQIAKRGENMTINIARYYKRKKWELDCEIITPMFLGNAGQEAELRAAPFKGLLRYWWRVANGVKYRGHKELLEAENYIFGSPDETGGKSRVTVEVVAQSKMIPEKSTFSNPGLIDHPECENSKHKTNPLNYLAGMGLIKNGIQHSYFPPDGEFSLIISAGHEAVKDVEASLNLFNIFGAIGSRSRNGWGSFFWKGNQDSPVSSMRNFSDAFDHDYPHCLGQDNKGPLFWKTKQTRSNWEDCMKDLAETYVSIRAGNKKLNIPKLDVNSGNPPDRHLLGYPIMHHNQVWGPKVRHASALRLIVRKETDGLRGYILHLPHLFSTDMWRNGKNRQMQIWQKVHTALDILCNRAQYEEARS